MDHLRPPKRSVPDRIAALRAKMDDDPIGGPKDRPNPPGFQDFKNRNPWDKWDDYPRWDKRGR